jgi:hypothetical protein
MKVAIVRGEDWEGLYINDRLMNENHSIMTARALEILSEAFNALPPNSNPIIEVEAVDADDEWLSTRGSLPRNLKDVKRA